MQSLHSRPRRAWDHRIRENICRTRNPDLYPELGIPRSTAATWLVRDCPEVVTLEQADEDAAALKQRVEKLKLIVRRLVAIIRLQRSLLWLFGISLEKTRLPDGNAKALILRAVSRARSALAHRLGGFQEALPLTNPSQRGGRYFRRRNAPSTSS